MIVPVGDRRGRRRWTLSRRPVRPSGAACAAQPEQATCPRGPRVPAGERAAHRRRRRQPGVRARVTGAIYQGGHFRVEALAEAAADVPLHLVVAEPCRLAPGDAINIAIDDGWVIPGAVTPMQPRVPV